MRIRKKGATLFRSLAITLITAFREAARHDPAPTRNRTPGALLDAIL
jgi:hypothetical protein